MELCVGGESIQAADTHMGMSRAVCHGPDWSGSAKEPRPATHSPWAGVWVMSVPQKSQGLKPELLTVAVPGLRPLWLCTMKVILCHPPDRSLSYRPGPALKHHFLCFCVLIQFCALTQTAPVSIVKCSLALMHLYPTSTLKLQTTPFHHHSAVCPCSTSQAVFALIVFWLLRRIQLGSYGPCTISHMWVYLSFSPE